MNTLYGRYSNRSSLKQKREKLRGLQQTKAEVVLWKYLKAKQFGVKFRRQYSIDGYIVDLYCHSLKLVIELDGWVHGEEKQKQKDSFRQKYLESKGYIVIRYRNEQIKYDLKATLQDIWNTIHRLNPSADPS